MSITFQNAEALFLELNRRGVSLQRRGDRLLCLPKGAAGELLPEIQKFKPSLLEMLEAEGHKAARERFPTSLKGNFPVSDQIAIGLNLLALDRGEDINEKGESEL